MVTKNAAHNQPTTNGEDGTTKPARMSLTALIRGRQERPLRALFYGVEGVGKSTLGADAPGAIFLGAEDGTAHLDVTRFPAPASWADMLEAIRVLGTEDHEFKTLVIDTLDWAEPMLWKHICDRDGKKDIEDYGYGKGYAAALDQWRVFLAYLERLRDKKQMHVILLAHSWIKPFKNPEGDDFDRYELKINNKAGGLIKEWCDHVLFANYETFASKDEKTKRIKGVSTGARLIYTTRTAAYDAKNRADLPESLPLDWSEFYAAVKAHAPADPAALKEEIARKAAELGGDTEKTALQYLTEAGDDAARLGKLNAWCNGKLATR